MSLPENVELKTETTSFLDQSEKQLFINNEWVAAQSGESFPSITPATGETLAT